MGNRLPFVLMRRKTTAWKKDDKMNLNMNKMPVAGTDRHPKAPAMIAMGILFALLLLAMICPSVALADIQAGNTVIHGYDPSDIVSTDMSIGDGTIDNLGPMLADKVVGIVMKALPILAVLSVIVLIYNAVRNMFLPDEDPHEARKAGRKPKRPMGQVLKDIFMMYFWILFAWIIVELIIYAVTHLETVATDTLSSPSSQQTTTQQVQQQPRQPEVPQMSPEQSAGQQPTEQQPAEQPSGQEQGAPSGTATPVGSTTAPIG